MKKMVVILIFSILLVTALVLLAFFYIEMSGHEELKFDVFLGGRPFGSVTVDRYSTADRTIYKSVSEYPTAKGYPRITQKLILEKRSALPVKFFQESEGTRGQQRIIMLTQDGENSDYLFLENPRFLTLKDFSTGEKTVLISPGEISTYMALMERYNFWKKGTQFFEVMIPVPESLPPMRDKVEVRDQGDEYISVGGQKVEAESYLIGARGVPGTKVFMSKYGHVMLGMEMENPAISMILTAPVETPADKITNLFSQAISVIDRVKNIVTVRGVPGKLADEAAPVGAVTETGQDEIVTVKEAGPREVFFENGSMILSGEMWVPAGEGIFPAVLMVPDDGPRKRGEEYLVAALGEFLSGAGFLVFVFDNPGQGKSQGDFAGLDDEKRINDIKAALKYLKERLDVDSESISMFGHRGGSYLAVKAALAVPYIRACVLLDLPFEAYLSGDLSKEQVEAMVRAHGLGPFDDGFMTTAHAKVQEHRRRMASSEDDYSFFMGVNMPIGGYKALQERKVYETITSFDRPELVILGRDIKGFDPEAGSRLKGELSGKNKHNKVAVLGNLGEYAGEVEWSNDAWRFYLNADVTELVEKWIKENGIARVPPEA
ncbi:MAG: alpha/beta hydrolase [Candidatus Tantalella remota]|nr:alpha/beta hydrolase [Candidatus Tantalella remota]